MLHLLRSVSAEPSIDAVLAFMDAFPQSRGHALVISKTSKARNILEVEPQVLAELMEAFLDAPDAFRRKGIYGEGGYDYGDNHIRFGFFSRAALAGPEVASIIHLRTMHLSPDQLLVAAKVDYDHSLSVDQLAKAIDDTEAALRAAVPIADIVYIEPDIRRSLFPKPLSRHAAEQGRHAAALPCRFAPAADR